MEVELYNSAGLWLGTITGNTPEDAMAVVMKEWVPDICEGDTIKVKKIYDQD